MVTLEYGLELKQEGRLHEAEKIFRKLLAADPKNSSARHHLGNTLVADNQLKEGLRELKIVFTDDPQNGLVAFNLGCALFQAQLFQEALAAFSRATALLPELIDARINRGSTYHALGRLHEALNEFDKALKQVPNDADSHWNRALTLLTMGRYKEGFKDYEWRWQRNLKTRTYPYKFKQKRWQGDPFNHQRLLVYSEQGLGDALQFARFLPQVKELGGQLIFEVRPELAQIFSNCKGPDKIRIFSPHKPCEIDFDLQIPLMSLPSVLDVEITQLPEPCSISVDPDKKAFWRQQLDPDKINIGLAWAGRASHINDRHRSLPLDAFNNLTKLNHVHFYSLQTGSASRQIKTFANPEKIFDTTSKLHNFTDTAALISELDLIISVDTAVAHLAASLGRPTWILLSYLTDWRWQKTGISSPWYPSVTLWRQPRPGDWKTILENAALKIKRESCATFTLRGLALRKLGKLSKAIKTIEQALEIDPDHAEAAYHLGLIEKERHQVAAASHALEKALKSQPDYSDAHIALGNLQQDLQNFDGASQHYHSVLKKEPRHPGAAAGLAQLYLKKGNPDKARHTLEPWLKKHSPETPETAVVAARLAETPEEQEQARRILESLLKKNYDDRSQRRQLSFTLAELLDKAGDYDAAFAHFQCANQAKAVTFDKEAHRQLIDELIKIYSTTFCKKMASSHCLGEKAVFIVGMPRSGTTLTEQFLAVHPQIHGAGELGNIRSLARNLHKRLNNGKLFPACVTDLTRVEAKQIGEEHLDFLTSLAPGAIRVIDKMPQNFLFLGLIQQILPQGHIIHCQRHPLDTIFSIYCQNFSALHSYAFDLENITFWYQEYHRLMRHWQNHLDISTITIDYEMVVADLEGEARKLLNFLDLDWHPATLNFHQRKEVVHSARYQQVKKPLYQSSVGRWHHYEKHLGKAIKLLHEEL